MYRMYVELEVDLVSQWPTSAFTTQSTYITCLRLLNVNEDIINCFLAHPLNFG